MTDRTASTSSVSKSSSLAEDFQVGLHDFRNSDQFRPVMLLAVFVLGLVVAFGNSLSGLLDIWTDPQYSHGYLIPAFSLFLLWMRRRDIKEVPLMERWAGVGVLGLGIAIWLGGSYFSYPIIEMWSFIPCLIGAFVLVGGWRILYWSLWPILFLVFMYPVPGVVRRNLMFELQHYATVFSAFALQTLGFAVVRIGNEIRMSDTTPLNVVDACAGLRMMTIFVALSVAIVLITKRSWWENLIIILSSIPIAVAVNVIRITLTGILYKTTSDKIAEVVFHDLAGYIMIPLAFGLLYLETQILSRLFIEDESVRPTPSLGGGHPGMAVKTVR